MNPRLRTLAWLVGMVLLGGCVAYPYPYPYTSPGSSTAETYDRSWGAALGAMEEQGLQIGVADRASGMIEGRRGGMMVRTRLVTQADGRVRIEFNTGGDMSQDPGLLDRITRSYNARMGR